MAIITRAVATAGAANFAVDQINLPPLVIQGEPAKAHTQGLEMAGNKIYVSARREDVRPKQALLLRTDRSGADWDVWDLTPSDVPGTTTRLDHPGGLQSDGTQLWIPVAQSRPNGRSIIRAFAISKIIQGSQLAADLEFTVQDHIGALAVSAGHRLLLGANWDTEKVYVWDLQGHLQRTLAAGELKARGLGVVSGPEGRSGVAVQDWKLDGNRLFASGLYRSPGVGAALPASRLIEFESFLERDFQRRTAALPVCKSTELAREAMAISDGAICFLPEDLGASNRMFRVLLAEVLKQATGR